MTDLFVPYNIAIAMKDLGYNGECFTYWNSGKLLVSIGPRSLQTKNSELSDNFCSAPTHQQVQEWFIQKYKMFTYVTWVPQTKNWIAEIFLMDTGDWIGGERIKSDSYNMVLNKGFTKIINEIKNLNIPNHESIIQKGK